MKRSRLPTDVSRLTGEKVRLRTPVPEDADAVMAIREADVSLYYGSPDPPVQWRREHVAGWVNDDPGPRRVNFCIVPLDDESRVVGTLSLQLIDWKNRNTMMGIGLHPDERGKGYGTDATTVAVDFAFDQLNLVKVYLGTFAFNEHAKHVYDKLGFVVEGVLRDERFRDGRYWDEYLMATWRDDARPSDLGPRG